ncbi:MAG: serine/threonine protein kinase [Anaerolineae bacterium]|nr:serine/threonine protein kinase [Anaerolineae bacterium]
MEPLKIGHYEIKDILGEGGMATVYHAFDPRFEREVALKMLHAHILKDEDSLARFRSEGKFVAKLDHPHIVPVYDIGEEDGKPYLVMRYMAGGSLRNWIKRGALSLAQATKVLEQISGALDEAHEHGIIHRDIKPGNIMLDQRGDIFLSDFGIVKDLYAPTQFTMSGAVIGTAAYMSAEQCAGKEVNSRSDIYALGVVLYEMLTGKLPFEEDSFFALLQAHIINPIPYLSETRADLPTACQLIIEKALAKNPEERYATAVEMYQDLKTALINSGEDLEEGSLFQPPVLSIAETRYRPSIPLNKVSIDVAKKDNVHLPVWARAGIVGTGLIVLCGVLYQAMAASGVLQLDLDALTITVVSFFVKPVVLWLVIVITVLIVFRFLPMGKIEKTILRFPKNSQPVSLEPEKELKKESPNPTILHRTNVVPPHPDQTIIIKPELSDWLISPEHLIEDLMQDDYAYLSSFISQYKQGRYVLTGYGRFGGTSMVLGAMERAKQDLSDKGKGALLAFYFEVFDDNNEQSKKIEIKANGFNFGVLESNQDIKKSIEDLGGKPLAHDNKTASAWHFSLETPIQYTDFDTSSNRSFFGSSGITNIFSKPIQTQEFTFDSLINELESFVTKGESPSQLKEIVYKLIGSNTLPAKIIIILDKIRFLETLEELAQTDLFKNDAIQVIAIARKEHFDSWYENTKRLNQIGFKEWYIPCNWEFINKIESNLIKTDKLNNLEAQEIFITIRKHWEFIGRGATGKTLEEIKNPKYWADDNRGELRIWLKRIKRMDNIFFNAWMQDVLSMNWHLILSGIFPEPCDNDRARIGVYYLVNWIVNAKIFNYEQLEEVAQNSKITISNNKKVVRIVIQQLLWVLKEHNFININNDNEYIIAWSRQDSSIPKKLESDNNIALPKSKKSKKRSSPTKGNLMKDGENEKYSVSKAPSSPESILVELPNLKLDIEKVDSPKYLARLSSILNLSFNEEELKTLCYKFGIQYDNIAGNTKEIKIYELIDYVRRRGDLMKFVELVCEERPNICGQNK